MSATDTTRDRLIETVTAAWERAEQTGDALDVRRAEAWERELARWTGR